MTHLEEDDVFTAAEVATEIKGIKSGKAAGGDEIRPEMLKALTGEGILWLTRVCQVAWKLGKTPRDWKTGVIIPIFKKEDLKQCTNYRGISLLSLPGKYMPNALKGNAEKYWNQNWKIISAVFAGSQHHGPNLHSEANLREILGVWQKSLHALSILKKHMTEFLGINFGRFCRSMALMVNC